MLHLAWPGDSIIARGRNGNQALRNALLTEVMERTPQAETVLLQDLGAAAPRVGSARLAAKRGQQWGVGASSSRGDNSLPR
jgi:hypothetical protein